MVFSGMQLNDDVTEEKSIHGGVGVSDLAEKLQPWQIFLTGNPPQQHSESSPQVFAPQHLSLPTALGKLANDSSSGSVAFGWAFVLNIEMPVLFPRLPPATVSAKTHRMECMLQSWCWC